MCWCLHGVCEQRFDCWGSEGSDAAFITANAVIHEYLQIGGYTVAGMSAAVIQDISDGSVAVENPFGTVGKTRFVESLQVPPTSHEHPCQTRSVDDAQCEDPSTCAM